MLYAKLDKTGQIEVWPIYDIRKELKNTSFPENIKQTDLPSGYILIEDPGHGKVPTGHKAVPVTPTKSDNGAWTLNWSFEPLSETENAKEVQRYNTRITEARQQEYRSIADPLFFKWQRNEATKDEWLAAVQDIKLRFPKI